MILQRPSSERGHAAAGRPESRYGFSFGGYYDPAWMGFGPLRVLNEDRLAPGAGFPATRGANMELLAFVVSGELAHEDAIGGHGTVRAGELQWLSAGHGVEHTERNASASEPLHLLQMWIQPSRLNHEPAYARREAVPVDARGWTLLASGDGREGSLAIRQDARVLQIRLDRGETAALELDASRLYWAQVVLGQVTANEERPLDAGDALGLREESGTLRLQGRGDERALVLLFDLPG
ncbi:MULTISPECIES: pirin family protein [unclassified Lysobacter]|uniref:pirin family protein n=1 Tax=unclassified Lysobacter TaxID=2635362 RepID=UPI001C2494D5|nr:pirin family protein [Lysobacter sp. MMG2]MBU8977695.1 pirin family protein [Lysobacter sp. MMG2]